jgi:hypothetical protein
MRDADGYLLLPAFPNMASGPLLTSNHRLAALTLTGAIEAAEDDEESERSNAAADRVSPESLNGARPALRCR